MEADGIFNLVVWFTRQFAAAIQGKKKRKWYIKYEFPIAEEGLSLGSNILCGFADHELDLML